MPTRSLATSRSEAPHSAPSYIAQVALLDSVVATVTRSWRMRREDAEDFRQTVYLRVAERNGDIFQRFGGRSSLRTYLHVVVRRMLLDWRNDALGKWRPSAAARRLGPPAESFERLVHRDGFPVDEAIASLTLRFRSIAPERLREIAAALPPRRAWRFVIADEQVVPFVDPIETSQSTAGTRRRRLALSRALAALEPADRRLVWLRYRRGQTVTTIAAKIGGDQKRLYRRFERILSVLRRELAAQGVTGTRPPRGNPVPSDSR